ncbi:hypothetical protein NDU88_006478 [Pleurodeles waltl]|uniref:Uncharacterized protein n=1 Tax=Pleurodeles waltl TaxID=8319 RepID=A0AAV7VPV8_PLEWA|nr:hypothetical protein NDU88_006478 [Pleurodeles waltl]
MCCPAVRDAESRALLRPGEASGERLRHWGRAALELRRVRRGLARIPLRGNPGRASIGKAPEKVSQEPDSVTTCYSTIQTRNFQVRWWVSRGPGAHTDKDIRVLPHPRPLLTPYR